MMWDNEYGWGAWLAMSVGMVAFWALLAVVVVALVRGMRADRPQETNPGRLLDERFARGEIAEDEFRRHRELLHSTSGSASGTARTR